MKTIVCAISLLCVSLAFSQEDRKISYWKHIDNDTLLAQVIHTINDQGESVYHINLFRSSCSTEIYYAIPNGEQNGYIVTTHFGEQTEHRSQPLLNADKFTFDDEEFEPISMEHYKLEMKRLELIKHKNSDRR